MTLKQLKEGNVVVDKNGNLYLIKTELSFLDVRFKHFVNLNGKGDDKFDTEYTEELVCFTDDNHTFVKVYENFKLEKIIWERKTPILTDNEIRYLTDVIFPFKKYIKAVSKVEFDSSTERPTYTYIRFHSEDKTDKERLRKICDIPVFGDDFSNLKLQKLYTLDELGLD